MWDLRYKFTIQRLNWQKISLGDIFFIYRTGTFFKDNFFLTFLIFSFKTDSLVLDPDPNWAKILDPEPNSMYLDPQRCLILLLFYSEMS